MKRMILLILLACGAASAATWQERVELYCVRNNVAGAVYGDNVFVSLEPSGPALVWRVAGVAAPALSDLPSEAETDAALYPQPDVTVPVVDADGNPVGTARLLVDAAGQLLIVTDSASPQRPWPDQKADAVAAQATVSTIKEQLRTLRDSLNLHVDALQAVDQTVFNGAQRTQFANLRAGNIDVARDLKELLRIVRALNKEVN